MGRMSEVRLDFVIGHMCYRLYHVVLNCTERKIWVRVDSINNITGKLDLDVAAWLLLPCYFLEQLLASIHLLSHGDAIQIRPSLVPVHGRSNSFPLPWVLDDTAFLMIIVNNVCINAHLPAALALNQSVVLHQESLTIPVNSEVLLDHAAVSFFWWTVGSVCDLCFNFRNRTGS